MTQPPSNVTVRLREMILRGDLQPGERVREAELALRLGTSRMPVRQALPALAQEGLLMPAGRKGYAVRVFTLEHSLEALRLRAVLEGFAARVLTERGAPASVMATLRECLAQGDGILAKRQLGEDDEMKYGEMNQRFHATVLEAANMPLLSEFTARCNLVPFTDPGKVAFGSPGKASMYDLLFYAHRQHYSIVQAIEARQADRAEFLFREHALTQEMSQTLDIGHGRLNMDVAAR